MRSGMTSVILPHGCITRDATGIITNEPPMIHPKTKAQLEKLLTMLAEEGEEKTFAYVRSVVLKKGRRKAGTKQGKGA